MTIDNDTLILLIIALTIGLLIGFVIASLRTVRYKAALKAEQQVQTEKLQLLNDANQKLSDSFSALSSKALQQNNEAFIKLAEQNLSKHQNQAQNELEKVSIWPVWGKPAHLIPTSWLEWDEIRLTRRADFQTAAIRNE